MGHKNVLIPFISFILILVSACDLIATPPVAVQPINPSGTAGPTDYSPQVTTVIGDPAEMYPGQVVQISTAYPAWDRPTVKLSDLTPPTDAHSPSEGKVSISGLLYANNISVPLADIQFVLMPAVMVEGTPIVPPILTNGNPENGDIIGKTDTNGVFYLDDIAPGKYYLVINYPDHSEIAVEPENTIQNHLFEFEADQSYPLGVIMILS
jgi:hypothetical protein